jgi:hypothetical protein
MSDEKETNDQVLSAEDLEQVAGGKPVVTGTVARPAPGPFLKIEGIPGESLETKHQDD